MGGLLGAQPRGHRDLLALGNRPFHFIWISLTLLYGFRAWSTKPTAWVLGVVMVTTFAAISWHVWHGARSVDKLNEVPPMAAMFWPMVWHAP